MLVDAIQLQWSGDGPLTRILPVPSVFTTHIPFVVIRFDYFISFIRFLFHFITSYEFYSVFFILLVIITILFVRLSIRIINSTDLFIEIIFKNN